MLNEIEQVKGIDLIRLLGIKFGFTLESFQTQITLNIMKWVEGEI